MTTFAEIRGRALCVRPLKGITMAIHSAKLFPMKKQLQHGHARRSTKNAGTGTYRAWAAMKARCQRPTAENFHNYGGRGITVCERWQNFKNFLEDMGERPPGLTLERKNNNAGYSKENCCWTTQKEQQRNRRNNRLVQSNGKLVPLVVAAEESGIPIANVKERIYRYGWTVEKALATSLRKFLSRRTVASTATGPTQTARHDSDRDQFPDR